MTQMYGKHPAFRVKEYAPYNGEPPLELLRTAFFTPEELFFARNHGAVPEIDAGAFRIRVRGKVRNELELSLRELQENFPAHTRAVTLQCAGNRRAELAAMAPIPGELPWEAGAIGTAEWRGTTLRDVLRTAGVELEAGHVAFTGLDEVERHGQRFPFGGSIPLEKALGSETLLAYEMNRTPLAPVHGFPLRAIIPGYIGARSVKWLAEVRVQETPSDNYFYDRAYQLFPAQARAETVDWASGIKLGELPVNSVICSPQDGQQVSGSPLRVQGFAISGGRRIARVDVSGDGGQTWVTAELGSEDNPWTWRLWETSLELRPGLAEIVARAWDTATNSQPHAVQQTWNFKGYMNNAWHRVRVVRE